MFYYWWLEVPASYCVSWLWKGGPQAGLVVCSANLASASRNDPETRLEARRHEVEAGKANDCLDPNTETPVTNARALAFTAALLIAILAFVPHPVSSDLSAGWKCSQNALMTSCRMAQQ